MIAASHDVTVRTLRNWQRTPIGPPVGRPRASDRAIRDALRAVRRVMRAQGLQIGERVAHAALLGTVPMRLVREALRRWKARDRARDRQERVMRRLTIVPMGPGVLGSLDAMQAGRVDGDRVMAEQIVDVVSGRTLAAEISAELNGEVVRSLLAQLEASDELPLVVAVDRGSENVNARVATWCAEHHVVLLKNVPRTPQHNPWVERKHREVRETSGLRASTVLRAVEDAAARFEASIDALDQRRIRARHGYVTNARRDQQGRVRYTRVQREALWCAVQAAQAAARDGCVKARDRPWAEREAALRVLEEMGLIVRYRGGVRVERVEAEIIS